jgi:hypothetical protein
MPTPLEAMTAAVQNPSADPAPPVVDPTPPVSTPEGGDPVAAPAVAAKPDIIGADPAAAATPPVTPDLDADGRMRGPDGKFVAATPKPEGEGLKEGAPPAAAKPAAAAPPAASKVVDPVNDPIPPTLKQETRERITTLVETVKAKDTEIAAVRDDFEMVMSPIRDSGASVEQFRESMNLVRLINSPNTADQQQALQYLQGAGAALAARLGVIPPGADPLQGYEDLQLEVQKNPGVRKWAEEAAAGRRLREATQRQSQEQQQRSEQTASQQRAAQAGQAAVRAVESALEAGDPQYKAKVAVLRADTAFIAGLKAMPPTQWAAAFAEKYRTIKVASPAAPAPATPSAPAPLRAKQPAGQAGKVPSTSLEAVSAAIAAVGA